MPGLGFFDLWKRTGSRLLPGCFVPILLLPFACPGQSPQLNINPTLPGPRLPIGGLNFCDNSDSMYQGGQYCISGGTSPQMPTLTYAGSSGACSSEYIAELDFAQPGDSDGNGESYGYYDSGLLPADTQWTVNWSLNQGDVGEYSEGGNGDLQDLEDGNSANEFTFQVYGQNPSLDSIITLLDDFGPPWWYGHTLTWETLAANPTGSGYGYLGNVQFYGVDQFGPGMTYTGTPVWGYPDGFGLSQLDGSPGANPSLVTDDSLWTWTTNLMYGVQVANQTQSAAYNHFSSQMSLMLADTSSQGLPPNYPNPVGGYCNFTWNGTGNNAYWNADWINKYNGGYWANWTGSRWSYGNSTNPNYTPNVCNQPSYTK